MIRPDGLVPQLWHYNTDLRAGLEILGAHHLQSVLRTVYHQAQAQAQARHWFIHCTARGTIEVL